MKKILSVLLMLTCVLGLAACGGVPPMEYDGAVVKKQCDFLYGVISSDFTGSPLEPYAVSTNNDDIAVFGATIMNSYAQNALQDNERTLRVDGRVVQNGISSWKDSIETLGVVTPSEENILIKAKADELNVRYYLNGTIHDGSIDFTYDKDFHVTSITVNPKYSMGESMEKATVNTIVGMGTVFVMLIVIMFIIMLLGKVCGAINGSAAKKEDKKDSVDKAIDGIVAREEIVEDEVTDDLELVAVITAAVAAAMENDVEECTDGFVVRSIRRIK